MKEEVCQDEGNTLTIQKGNTKEVVAVRVRGA